MMTRAFQVIDSLRVWDMAPADQGSSSESSDAKSAKSLETNLGTKSFLDTKSLAAKTNKISPEFEARLSRLEPQQKIRAIVLLETGQPRTATSRRQTYTERQAAIAHMREVTHHSMGKLNRLLQRFDGHPLAQAPDPLGSVPIELNAAGIVALTDLPWVKAILEDQDIHSLQRSDT